jgi:hypothetical protein
MTITVTKNVSVVSIDLKNETTGSVNNLKFTPEDAGLLAEKILAALAVYNDKAIILSNKYL